MTPRSLVWILIGAAAITGCGKASEPASTPASPDTRQNYVPGATSAAEPEPATLEEAEAALERARAELEALAMNEPVPAPPAAAAGAPAPARSEEREADTAAEASEAPRDADAKDAETKKAGEDPCDTACKAFASLRRARDAVCRLDAPSGARCARADGILRDAGTRVASCRCGP